MLNHIVLHGRLTRDPELRRTQSGVPVAGAGLAVDRDALNKEGVREVDFIDIVAWRSTAEFLCKHWRKGKEILVSGRLQMTSWNDNQGNKRWKAEVVADSVYFCGSRNDGGGTGGADGRVPSLQRAETGSSPSSGAYAPPSPQGEGYAGDFAPLEGDDSELPF